MTQLNKINSSPHTTKSLSVQVSLIGHSFLVKNAVLNTVLFSHSTTFDTIVSPDEALIALIKTFSEYPELKDNFDSIFVLHQNDLMTVVPHTLFEETEAANYLKFNTKILPTDFVAFDTISTQQFVVVYVPYVNINNYFFETYGSFQYNHFSTLAIKVAMESANFKENTTVCLDIAKDTFYCTVIEKGKLLLHNVYSYKTNEDFIYYVLFCFEQLQLDPNITPVTLSGSIIKEDSLYTLLYKYIRHISFVTIPDQNNTSNKRNSFYLLNKATL
jgi:branched-subunit amino acid transport protein AzlD